MIRFLFSVLIVFSFQIQAADLVVALKPDKDPEKMLEERKNLETFLSKELGKPVKVIVPLSSSVIIEGFKNGTVDLGYLGSLDMHIASLQNAADVLLVGEIKNRTFYESFWVTKKEKPYKSIEDLKGKPVAFSSRTSTSGYLVPHKDLIERKLLEPKQNPEAFFGKNQVWYGSGYVTAIERVLDGSSEAAAVSDYVILEDKHLTPQQKSQLKIIGRQGPVPTHSLAVRKTLPANEKDILKRALLKLNEKKNRNLRDDLFTSKLVEADGLQHLEGIVKALDLTGADLVKKN